MEGDMRWPSVSARKSKEELESMTRSLTLPHGLVRRTLG